MALPAHMYGDPAKVVENDELHRLGCSLCQSSAITLMRAFCDDPRNVKQAGFPSIGHRCKWFAERQAPAVNVERCA